MADLDRAEGTARQDIDVVWCVDSHYLEHALTSLASAVRSSPSCRIRPTLVTDGISTGERQLAAGVAERLGVELSTHEIDPADISHLATSAHLTPMAYARLLLTSVLPDHRQVLYLDADTVVVDDLGRLVASVPSETTLAAVVNPRFDRWGELGLEPADGYFNTGVLLMDLDRLRESCTTERALSLADARRFPIADQDALNATVSGDWHRLDPRWNAQVSMYRFSPTKLDLAADTVRRVRDEPGIVHYSGSTKPWHHHNNHPWRSIYHHWRAVAGLPPADTSPTRFSQRAKLLVKRVTGIP